MRRPDRVHAKLESLTVPEPLLVHSTVGFPSQVFGSWPYHWLLDTFFIIYSRATLENAQGVLSCG